MKRKRYESDRPAAAAWLPNAYRVRVGDYRACYFLDHEADVMEVFEVADKKDISYR